MRLAVRQNGQCSGDVHRRSKASRRCDRTSISNLAGPFRLTPIGLESLKAGASR